MVKTMYDELILKLREDAEFLEISSKYNNTKNEFAERISQAADAIEKLSMKLHGDEAAIAGMKREIERMVVSGNKPRWIPVTERLPEEYKDVLCYYEYFRYGDFNCMFRTIDRGYYGNGIWGGEAGQGHKNKVLAWMPLPEPPKGDNP